MKKICRFLLFFSTFCFIVQSHAQFFLGQTLQINTHFNSILGKPTWLLIVREVETGTVLPYIFEVRKNNNFWIAFTAGRSYVVTASELKFNPCFKITNFCHLQDGIISGKSMWISVGGILTPDGNSVKCRVMQYQDAGFRAEVAAAP